MELGAGARTSDRSVRSFILDSGASASVAPVSWLPPSVKRELHPADRVFTTAGGTRVKSQGLALIRVQPAGGPSFKGWFHVLPIGRALISVSQLINHGYQVTFGEEGGQVHLPSGDFLGFESERGVFALRASARALPATKDGPDFPRQA